MYLCQTGYVHNFILLKGKEHKGKVIPLQARCGPEGE